MTGFLTRAKICLGTRFRASSLIRVQPGTKKWSGIGSELSLELGSKRSLEKRLRFSLKIRPGPNLEPGPGLRLGTIIRA